MRSAWNGVIAEMVGTFLFFFVGIGAAGALAAAGSADGASSLIVVALAHGIVLAVLVSALGAVSGAHFNPAVTFAVWVAGQIPWRRGLAYVLAQLIGAIAAGLAVEMVYSSDIVKSATPALATGLDPLTGILVETILTVILLIAVFGTAIDPRGPKVGGLAIGFRRNGRHPDGWPAHRRGDEPGALVRPGSSQLDVGQQLRVDSRPARWRGNRRAPVPLPVPA